MLESIVQSAAPATSVRQTHLGMEELLRNSPENWNLPIVIEGKRQSTVEGGMADGHG
jgi:hypothetical protein